MRFEELNNRIQDDWVTVNRINVLINKYLQLWRQRNHLHIG